MKTNKAFDSYNELLTRIYGPIYEVSEVLEATFQVTEACTLACSYCYQGSKSPKVMTLDTAKKYIDTIFNEFKDNKLAIILDFIGGEPLLQPDLISDIIDYWDYKCIMENLLWGELTRFSLCTNGTEYFTEASQKLLQKMGNAVSLTVSIDGNKELHDSARVHLDGRGSYDEAKQAADDYEKRYNLKLGSKMTIAPGNIIFLYPALKHYLDSGAEVIYANCVYEEGWTLDHAKLLYQELKRLADYKLKYYPDTYISLFEEQFFKDISLDEDQNYCGGRGKMLACDPDGILYPCLRYMPSSVGRNREYYITCGNVEDGLDWTMVDKLQACTRKVVTSEKCLKCPIAAGCGECFPAGTFVSTPNGKIAIENIKVGDEVYDYNGNIQTVTALINKKANELVNLKAIGIDNLSVTRNHPFLVKNEKGINWIKADQIKVGDCLAILTPYSAKKTVNKNIAYLAGRYLGDGYKQNSYRKKTPYRYGIVCGKTEVEELKSKLDLTDVGYSYREMRTAYDFKLHTSDTEDAKLLYSIIKEQGRRASDKHVAPEVFTWDVDSIKSYLKGYMDADGYYDSKRNSYKCTSISYQLILDIAELIWITENKLPYIVPRKRTNNIIEGRKVNIHPSYELSYYASPNGIRQKYSYDLDNNYIWTPVKSTTITQLDEEIDVYNLSISNTETYIANRVVVHNCAAYSWQVTNRIDQRVEYICLMHQARALANVYYWNKYYKLKGINNHFRNNVPEEWALQIIDKDELAMLYEISGANH